MPIRDPIEAYMSTQTYPSPSIDFRVAFESIRDNSILVCADEPEFTILAATRTLLRYFKRERDEVVGIGLFEAFPATAGPSGDQMRAPVINALRAAARKKLDQTLDANRFDIQGPSGEPQKRFWNVTFNPVINESGQVNAVIIAGSDVTETALEAAKIRKTLMESILSASFDGIYALEVVRNPTGEIIDFTYRFANRITASFLGLTEEEIVGKRMLELIPENRMNGFFDLFCRALSTGETIHDQTLFESSQMKHWFNYVVVPISDDTLVVTIQDISEQKRDEEILRNQKLSLESSLSDLKNANDNLERFAFAASHDLQEPLRKVQMFFDLLLQHSAAALDEKAHNYVQKIVTSVSRMKQLITDLLQFSQQSTEVRYVDRVDMNELLNNVESDLEVLIAQQRAVIVRDELPAISGNATQLNQLFHNLYTNALKFSTPEATEPRLRITSKPVHPAAFSGARSPGRMFVSINVTDNGIGFDQKYSEKIFELFSRLHSTAKYPGSGIGLALCKKIALNHGGDIIASSGGNRGASFDVILPLA